MAQGSNLKKNLVANFKLLIYLSYKISIYICVEKKKMNMKIILKKTLILIFLSSFNSAFAADET